MLTKARRFLQISWRYPAVIPLVTIVSTALVGGVTYIGYLMATKQNLRRGIKQQINFTAVDPTLCCKLYSPSPKPESPKLVEVREKLYRA